MAVDTKADTGHRVLFRGKTYKLWKRGDRTSSPYWCRVQVRGKPYPFSTDTADVKLARDRAKVQLAKILDGNWRLIYVGPDLALPKCNWRRFSMATGEARKWHRLANTTGRPSVMCFA